MEKIQERANYYQEHEADAELDTLANVTIPEQIDKIKAELETINNKIIEAQGKLEDAEIGVDVATFHKNSLDLMVQAQVTNKHVADLRNNVAKLGVTASNLRVQQATLVRLQHGELLHSKEIHLEQARAKLRHVYQICRLHGIDPTTDGIAAADQPRGTRGSSRR